MTHDELVIRAAKWLRGHGCYVVITELTGWETADAIGFDGGGRSTLIECKTSLEDFKADQRKPFRRESSLGMGHIRYYMTPPGLLTTTAIPAQWGLIEVVGKICKVTVEPTWFNKYNKKEEMVKLISLLRRIGHNAPRGASIKTYNFFEESKCKATLGTEYEDDYII